jgi:hypothetical protein
MDITQLMEAPAYHNIYARRPRIARILFSVMSDSDEEAVDERDKSMRFSAYVNPTKTTADSLKKIHEPPKLALELQLAVARYCHDSAPALWTLMHTNSPVRKDAQKLFWAIPDVWFLYNGDLDCVCSAATVCDPHVRPFVQQLVLPIERTLRLRPAEAQAWWHRLRGAFPAIKKVWLIGGKWDVKTLVDSWTKEPPGSEAVELVTAPIHANPTIWNRDGTRSDGDSSNWKVVHLPEPDAAVRTFRGSDPQIEQLLKDRIRVVRCQAELAKAVPGSETNEAHNDYLRKLEAEHALVEQLDERVTNLRSLRGAWGKPGSAEWNSWEHRFWTVLSVGALLSARPKGMSRRKATKAREGCRSPAYLPVRPLPCACLMHTHIWAGSLYGTKAVLRGFLFAGRDKIDDRIVA